MNNHKTRSEVESPQVSVIIPCCNQGEFLPSALHSVLAQTYSEGEIIVIDDGSGDETAKVAEDFIHNFPQHRIRLIRQENQGLASARNAGVMAAQGEFILPLDADDLLHPLYLEKTVPILRAEPQLGYVYVMVHCFGEENKFWTGGEFNFKRLLNENLMACATLFRKSAWEAAGGYNPNMKYGFEDWDLWIGMGEKGYFGKLLKEPLFLYRKHGQTMLGKAYAEHDAWSRARIVMNHPDLYPPEAAQAAEKILEIEGKKMNPPRNNGRKSILIFHYEKPLNPTGVNGGAEMALIHMAKSLAKRGCQVTVAGWLKGAPGVFEGVKYIDLGENYDYVDALNSEAPQHQILISSARVDVLEESRKYPNLKLRLLWLHVDSLSVARRRASEIERICDGVICVSQSHKSMMMRQGLSGDIIHVIYNGADADLFRPVPGIQREMNRIAYAGALVPSKGVHNLIQAFQIARRQFPKIELHIYGSADMWGESEYLDLENNNPEITRIHFHGKVSQVKLAEELSRSALLAAPSLLTRAEPYPLTPLDAQACECPALVTPSGGLPEGVENGVTGLVADDDSVQSLAKALVALMSQPEKLAEMGKAGRKRILGGHTWMHAANNMLEYIDKMVKSKSSEKEMPEIEIPLKNKIQTTDLSLADDNKPLRVAMMSTYNQKCGLATYAGYLLEHYDPKNTFVLAEKTDLDREGIDGENVHRLWRRGKGDYAAVEKFIHDQGIDVLHINFQMVIFPEDVFFHMLNRLRDRGVRVVFSLHATDGLYTTYQYIDNSGDAVLVHMPYNRYQLAAMGCNPRKIQVIPHGIPQFTPADRKQIRRDLGLPEEMPLFMSFGFIEPHKGILENIIALSKLKRTIPFLYVIMGGAHPHNPIGHKYIEECRKKVEELGLTEEVQFLIGYNPIEQVLVMLNAADAVIMNYKSNRYETSGAAALALGGPAPVITSNAPPFADLDKGILRITENNTLDLVLKQLLAVEGLKPFLKAERAELIKERNWKRTAEKILRIYHTLKEKDKVQAQTAKVE